MNDSEISNLKKELTGFGLDAISERANEQELRISDVIVPIAAGGDTIDRKIVTHFIVEAKSSQNDAWHPVGVYSSIKEAMSEVNRFYSTSLEHTITTTNGSCIKKVTPV